MALTTKHPFISIVAVLAIASTVDWLADCFFKVIGG